MRRDAGKADLRLGGVKVLVNNLPQLAAVDGPGKLDVETLKIQRLGPAQAYLLIGHKGHHDIAMLMLCGQILQQGHDYRYRRLVIRAQHAGAVAKDNLFPWVG